MNKHKKTKDTAHLRGVAVILTMLLFLTGCTTSDNPFSSESIESSISIDDLNINVKYAESYDQTTITFSRHWPDGITAGFGKMISPNNGEIMTDYERISEIIAYDNDGYLSIVREFLEGDEKMNMPESAYNKLEDAMPSRDRILGIMHKEEMSGGSFKHFDKNGALLHEYSYDQELYKITLDELAAFRTWQEDNNDAVNSNVEKLQNKGINFEIVDDIYAKYSIPVIDHGFDNLRFEYIENLRTGLQVGLISYKEDGEIQSIQTSQYAKSNGFPVLSKLVTYQYGNINGKWDIAYKTIMTRENIEVLIN
jgi:hypothetical protein